MAWNHFRKGKLAGALGLWVGDVGSEVQVAGPTGQLYQSGTALTATAAEINTLDLSVVGGAVKIKKIPVTRVAKTDEQDTGWALPTKAIVLDVLLDVITKEATGGTKTVTVGTLSTASGDADGYLNAGSVADAGLVRGKATITAGASESYFASTTRGALLATLVAGADVAGDVGTYYEFPDTTMGGKKISYSLGSADFAELVANIIVVYIEVA